MTSSLQNFFYEHTFTPEAARFFFVVKINPGLAIRSIVFIPEALVLSDCFNSFIDETGQGTQFPAFRAIFSAIFTHKTTLLKPVTHFWLSRYEKALTWYVTTLMIWSHTWKNIATALRKVWLEIARPIWLCVITSSYWNMSNSSLLFFEPFD